MFHCNRQDIEDADFNQPKDSLEVNYNERWEHVIEMRWLLAC